MAFRRTPICIIFSFEDSSLPKLLTWKSIYLGWFGQQLNLYCPINFAIKNNKQKLQVCTPYKKEDSTTQGIPIYLTPCHLLCGRSILAMASTVKTLLQTRTISQKCGQKSGLAGKSHMLLLLFQPTIYCCGY